MDLDDHRQVFFEGTLRRADLDPDALRQFARWRAEVTEAGLYEPEAMVVATVDEDGRPSARQVLLRGVDTGFVFFSNYRSRKGRELAGNPNIALCFTWNELARQVRVVGTAEQLSSAESDAYWATRERGSQLAAMASAQSTVLPDRAALEALWDDLAVEYDGRDVPRPEWWGGYRVVPSEVELWHGRPRRMHDRFRYTRPTPDAPWTIDRLSP